MTPASVLIVDDIEANRETIRALLDMEGYHLLEAADGATALRMAAETPPDLVLLDVMMPGMDGFEVCRRLRADARLAEVPVIMLTALDDQASRMEGIEAGADDFVSKPFNRMELRGRIRTITRLNRYRRLHQATDRIREQAELISLAPDAIFVCDLDGRITYWNPAAEQLYGWSSEEAIGQRAAELLAKGANEEAGHAALLATETSRAEVTCVTRDGKAIIVDSRRKLLRDDAGNPRAILTINTDLTEKKQLEAQFLRTQRLETIGTLATGIAHDLNNVLAPIMISIEMLRLENHDEGGNESLDMLEASAHHGADLIRQILGFARGAGKAKAEVQLRHLAEASVKILSGTLPRNIAIKTKFPADLWTVSGSPSQLDQVLMNLCVNARDAMIPAGGELRVSLANVTLTDLDCIGIEGSRPGNYVCATVADTGIGIAPEVLARIFDSFFTTKQEGHGTGLGLATVQTVLKTHEGFISVESKLGSGSCFRVFFPALAAEVPAFSEHPTSADLPRGNGELLLMVDDDAATLNATARTLEKFGYRTIKACDGIEAIKRYSENSDSIRLVITDERMPRFDGRLLVRTLSRIAPNLPTMLVTGALNKRDATEDCDSTAFLGKPFTASVLLGAVRDVLNASRQADLVKQA